MGTSHVGSARIPKEDADVSARTAAGGGGWAGRTRARAPGSRAAVLQCRALRRATAPAPDARRPGVAGGARHSSHADAGTAGAFSALRERTASPSTPCSVCERSAGLLSGRPPGCGAGPDTGHAVPIRRSIGSVWARRAGCASKAVDAGFTASRTSATIPDCALCCRSRRRGTKAFSSGTDDHLPALIDWNDPVVTYGSGSSHQIRPPGQRHASSPRAQRSGCQGDRYCRAIGAGRGALSQAEAHGRRRTPSGWIWVPPPSPSFHVKERRACRAVL